MEPYVFHIEGSKSDDSFAEAIVKPTLQSAGIRYKERRIASAHRTSGYHDGVPSHLDIILSQIPLHDNFVIITSASMSDGLSGSVAGRPGFSGRVVSWRPDVGNADEHELEIKRFSSAYTPSGVDVKFVSTPEEAVKAIKEIFASYDPKKIDEVYRKSIEKRDQTIMDDARLQGIEDPLPYTVFKRGKTRDAYDLGDGTLLIRASDRVSAFDVILPEKIPGKGKSLTDLSEYWFKLTKGIFPNHLIERMGERDIRVKKAKRIDIEWVVRGYLYGSLARAYEKGERSLYGINFPDGLVLAQELPQSILTATTKSETGHDEPITKELAIERGLVKNRYEWDLLEKGTFNLFDFYKKHAKEKRVIIPDFKLEFGIVDGEYTQIDEPPTHDSARFWAERYYQLGENQESHALDKEFLRQFLIKMGYSGDGEPPHLPELVIDQVSRRCVAASHVLRGVELDISKFGLKSVEEVLEELRRI